jgi:spore coat protein U-like protein
VCLVIAAVAAAAALTSERLDAATPVTATVVGECAISATPLAFGAYDPVSLNATSALDASASLSLACTRGVVATVGLDAGTHANGSVRRMAGGADLLIYNLFQNASRTIAWTDSGAGALTLPAATSMAPRTIIVYGRIAPGQDVAAGAYADSIIATVNF